MDLDPPPPPHQPTWALIDIDPGPGDLVRGRAGAGPAPPDRARAPRRPSGARGSAAGGASRSRSRWPRGTTFDQTRGLGRVSSRGASGPRSPPAGELVVAQGRPSRPGPPRLHAERHQSAPWSRRTARERRRERRYRCPWSGTSSTIPTSAGRVDAQDDLRAARGAVGIRSDRCSAWRSACPRSEPGRRRSRPI